MLMSELPPIILAELTSWIRSIEIGRLWHCGSPTLNWKLSEGGGVTKFEHTAIPNSSGGWPSILRLFPKITHLSIVDPSYSPNKGLMNVDLSILPRNLKKLRFWFRNDAILLESALHANPLLFSNLQELALCMAADISTFPTLMMDLPSTIRDLDIHSPYGEEKLSFSFRLLPPFLTSHRGRYIGLSDDIEDEDKFPETLTSLTLQFPRSSPSFEKPLPWFPRLPSGLIKCYISGTSQPLDADWNIIPRTVEFLTVACAHFGKDQLEALPPKIHTISISEAPRITSDLLQYVPKTLTYITGVLPEIIDANIASMLPRGLTNLSSCDILIEAIPHLPSNTKRLRIRNRPAGGSVEGLSSLSSLSHIEFIDVISLDANIAEHLPKTLREMSIDSGPISDLAIPLLPRTLTSLVLIRHKPFESDLYWKDLPPCLTTMDILPVNRDVELLRVNLPDSAAMLPRSLTKLTLGHIDVCVGVDWYAGFPQTLTVLDLNVKSMEENALLKLNTPVLTSMTISIHVGPTNGLGHIITSLPKSLKTLNLRFTKTNQSESKITNEHLLYLPHAITTLTIPKADMVTEDIKPHLPKNLVSLEIGTYAHPPWFKR
jgi:hypothetical protein